MGDKPDYENGEPKPIPNDGSSMHDLVINDLQERKDYGLNKYDSLLQAYNGRNFLQDIYEELQDGIVYMRGALEEQKVVSFFIRTLLQGYKATYDSAYPDDGEPLIDAVNLPGWVVAIAEEELGDRFVHRTKSENSVRDSE
jgi:hypothetical protein